jgi:hypothetical protein
MLEANIWYLLLLVYTGTFLFFSFEKRPTLHFCKWKNSQNYETKFRDHPSWHTQIYLEKYCNILDFGVGKEGLDQPEKTCHPQIYLEE